MYTLMEYADHIEANARLLKTQLEVLPQLKTLKAKITCRHECRALLKSIRNDTHVLTQELT